MGSLFSTTTSEVGMEEYASLGLPHYALPASNSSQHLALTKFVRLKTLAIFYTGFCALPKPLSRLNGYYLQAIGDPGLGCKGNTLNRSWLLAASHCLAENSELEELEKGSGPQSKLFLRLSSQSQLDHCFHLGIEAVSFYLFESPNFQIFSQSRLQAAPRGAP